MVWRDPAAERGGGGRHLGAAATGAATPPHGAAAAGCAWGVLALGSGEALGTEIPDAWLISSFASDARLSPAYWRRLKEEEARERAAGSEGDIFRRSSITAASAGHCTSSMKLCGHSAERQSHGTHRTVGSVNGPWALEI